jgi:hypothetical protein
VKLIDLDPRWFSRAGDVRHGISFECPCCVGTDKGTRLAVAIHVDGTNFDPDPSNAQQFATGEHVWNVTGSSFEDLSLTPSVDASKHGHWHGFITAGEIR